MIIEQTVTIPANHRIFFDLPFELPVGRARITITPEVVVEREKKPVFGCAKGQFRMTLDFDEPLDDF